MGSNWNKTTVLWLLCPILVISLWLYKPPNMLTPPEYYPGPESLTRWWFRNAWVLGLEAVLLALVAKSAYESWGKTAALRPTVASIPARLVTATRYAANGMLVALTIIGIPITLYWLNVAARRNEPPRVSGLLKRILAAGLIAVAITLCITAYIPTPVTSTAPGCLWLAAIGFAVQCTIWSVRLHFSGLRKAALGMGTVLALVLLALGACFASLNSGFHATLW